MLSEEVFFFSFLFYKNHFSFSVTGKNLGENHSCEDQSRRFSDQHQQVGGTKIFALHRDSAHKTKTNLNASKE